MKLSKKSLLTILIISVLVRLLLMVTAYHQDLSGQILSTHFFAYKNVLNIYDYLASLPSTHPLVKNYGVADIFIYPPLAYFTLGSYLKLISPLVPEQFFLDHMNGVPISHLNPIFHLFIFKLPYLLLDLLLAYLLRSFFEDKNKKNLISALWLLNPITLYTTAAMGVFDIIPVIFTALSVIFARKNKLALSALMIGFGAAYKSYPLFLLPLLLVSVKSWSERVKLFIIGLLPYLATVGPFLSSPAFKYMVFGPKSQKMFFLEWLVSGAEGLYPYVIGYFLLMIVAARKISPQKFWISALIYFLILFGVTNYHPQWYLWISPLVLIELVENNFKNRWLVFGLFLSYLFIVLTFDQSLSIGLFKVTFPNLEGVTGFDKLIAAKADLNLLRGTARSFSAAISLYLSQDLVHEK